MIPNVIKGGFVIAGRFGRGVLLVREPNGALRGPSFVTFTGGSVGWQVGLQSTDVVLVFKNRKGVETMLSGGEFTLGADASVAAGPVGRQASAGTDIKLNAEVYSYSRARGLFVGAALDGSMLKVDPRANAAYYAGGAVPPPAIQLAEMVAQTAPASPAMLTSGAIAVPPATATVEQLRAALVEASQRLDPLVDNTWKKYLALPEQVMQGKPPVRADLVDALARYDRVSQDSNYKVLADRPEFRSVHDLLHRFLAASDAAAAAASAAPAANAGLGQLPPPPPAAATPVTIGPSAAVPVSPKVK